MRYPPKRAEKNSLTGTASNIEAVETGYQPVSVDATFHPFLRLPAEVRCIVYEKIASTAGRKRGRLNIFKTSKLVRTEGAETSARHCIFFLWFGRWGHFRVTAPDRTRVIGLKATKLFQNIELQLNVGGFESARRWPFDHRQIGYFGGSEVMRKSCQITLDTAKKDTSLRTVLPTPYSRPPGCDNHHELST